MTASFPGCSAALIAPQIKAPEPAFNILNSPVTVNVKEDHICTNFLKVVANRGASVAVFAWTKDGAEAIAHNPQNETSGRIPVKLLEKESSKPFLNTTLCMAKADESAPVFDHVGWKVGDHVRVWAREDESHSRSKGFCFVVSTGEIGKFSTVTFRLTAIRT